AFFRLRPGLAHFQPGEAAAGKHFLPVEPLDIARHQVGAQGSAADVDLAAAAYREAGEPQAVLRLAREGAQIFGESLLVADAAALQGVHRVARLLELRLQTCGLGLELGARLARRRLRLQLVQVAALRLEQRLGRARFGREAGRIPLE